MAESVLLFLDPLGEPIDPRQSVRTFDSFEFRLAGVGADESAPETTQSGDDEAEDSIVIDYGAVDDGGFDDAFGAATDDGEAALLLPAVQSVREAAARASCCKTGDEIGVDDFRIACDATDDV